MKDKYVQERKKMIEQQLKPRGIKDPEVLEAFLTVPRHEFVPENLKHNAYQDRPLPIQEGQTISQPFIVAQMIEALKPKPGKKMLEVGTGSGYATAVLSRIINRVYSIERYPELAEQAEKKFEKLGYDNIEVTVGDGTKGWEEKSPFAGIMVSAAAPDIPEPLIEQLEVGGYLVIPVGGKNLQDLYQVKKISDNDLNQKNLGSVRFVPLVGEEGWAF
ncbi:MAG: protein-L-isoaspartate(D-aspartate) O-methyltransferase [Bacillota bacterium]